MKTLICALLLAACCHADTITTSTTCQTEQMSTSGSLNCGATSTTGSVANATANPATVMLTGTTVSVNEVVTGYTSVPFIMGVSTFATDTAETDFSAILDTPGVARSGFLALTWNANSGDGYSEHFSSTFKLGAIINAQTGNGPFGYFCCSILEPIELGVPLSFELDLRTTNSISAFDGLSGATDHSSVSLQLLEADGVTPVQISDVAPEPATLALLALGGLTCSGLGRRGRRSWPAKPGAGRR
jgi:hypothetical protein